MSTYLSKLFHVVTDIASHEKDRFTLVVSLTTSSHLFIRARRPSVLDYPFQVLLIVSMYVTDGKQPHDTE